MIVSLLVLVGMWLERYMIILHQPEPRFSAVVLGLLQADDLGHADLCRFGRACSWSRSCCSPAFSPILSMSETRALLPGAHGPEVGR